MAAPDAPASVTVKQGGQAQSVRLACATTAGAVTYTFYYGPQTGVTVSAYKGKRSSTHNYITIPNIGWRKVYMVATGTNVGAEESDASSEGSGKPAQ